jgi:WD40 repeat protein
MFHNVDDNILLSGSYDKTVRVWDLKKMKEISDAITSFEHKGYVNAIHYNRETKRLYTASTNMSMYSFEQGKQTKKLPLDDKNQHKDEVLGFAANDSAMLFTCSNDTTVKVFDLNLNKSINTMKSHKQSVPCIGCSSTSIYSASADGTLVRWAMYGYYEEESIQAHSEPIRSLHVLERDSTFIATGAQDNSVKLWKHE